MRATAYRSRLTDPYSNLALENSVYESLGPEDRALFLCRNEPSIIIGRHQNPWRECDLQAMRRDGVKLVRRQSGGGTVYHDLGNLNYTFFAPRESYDQEAQFQVVIAALARFGITAERSGRNDLLVEGRKISGSAFKHKRERSFHHGTVLIDSDLERLNRYLEAPERRMESKGIASVRSVVVKARELSREVTFDTMCDALEAEWARYVGLEVARRELDAEALHADQRAGDYAEEIRSWGWLYGKTPDFTELHTLPLPPDVAVSPETAPGGDAPAAAEAGELTLSLSVRRGTIAGVERGEGGDARTDSGASISTFLEQELVGLRYDRGELLERAHQLRSAGEMVASEVVEALAQRV